MRTAETGVGPCPWIRGGLCGDIPTRSVRAFIGNAAATSKARREPRHARSFFREQRREWEAQALVGAAFGLARGMLVVMILVLLAGLTTLPRQAVWRNAVLSDPLEGLAGTIKAWLPAELAQRITYR